MTSGARSSFQKVKVGSKNVMALRSCKSLIYQHCKRSLHGSRTAWQNPAWIHRGRHSLPIHNLRVFSSQVSADTLKTQGDSAKSPELQTEQTLEVPENREVIDPLKDEDFFGVGKLFTLQDLYDARVHLGHKKGLRHDHMKRHIFGNRLGIDIIDLDQTAELLQTALNFTAHIAYREGIILFLTRHQRTLLLVEQTAQESGEYSHCRHFKGGTFTNASYQFGAVTHLPDLCIFISCLDTIFEKNEAQIEAAKMSIPAIGILDTDCDPRYITYPVPGNDDSVCAIELYCKLFKQAILLGKEKRKELMSA